jgi:methylmalonyl-CoA mutase N-terminal domain/subunit
MRDQIEDAALRFHRAVESGEKRIVGLNANVEETEPPVELQRIDPAVERGQVERVRALRAARDGAAVERLLEDVRAAARGGRNLLPAMREALRARATVGEVCGVLRVEWGEYDRLLAARG